jgi:hypothetical protein
VEAQPGLEGSHSARVVDGHSGVQGREVCGQGTQGERGERQQRLAQQRGQRALSRNNPIDGAVRTRW